MKKFRFLIVVLATLLAACGGSNTVLVNDGKTVQAVEFTPTPVQLYEASSNPLTKGLVQAGCGTTPTIGNPYDTGNVKVTLDAINGGKATVTVTVGGVQNTKTIETGYAYGYPESKICVVVQNDTSGSRLEVYPQP